MHGKARQALRLVLRGKKLESPVTRGFSTGNAAAARYLTRNAIECDAPPGYVDLHLFDFSVDLHGIFST